MYAHVSMIFPTDNNTGDSREMGRQYGEYGDTHTYYIHFHTYLRMYVHVIVTAIYYHEVFVYI